MDIFPVGRGAVAIYIYNEELTSITPQGSITAAVAADILKNALGPERDRSWERAHIELFTGRDSTLLFARIPAGAPRFFRFDGSEPLISAAKACPRGMASQLTYLDGAYILTVYPSKGEAECAPLLEYGQPLDCSECFEAYLSEHGKLIDGHCALDTFHDRF